MLELEDLSRRYGDTVALDGVSFAVAPGRICGFLGPNGSGKTTAMRIVMGVAEADAGRVRWNGRPATHEDRLRFGYLPEERGLYAKMGVRDHLVYLARLHGLPRVEAEEASDRWLDQVGLTERAGDRVEALSLGNQQRVQLAAALTHRPEVLVLDEPFSGLDPIGVDTMSQVLRQRAGEGVAVVFSSHQLDLVEHLCDDVSVVNRGRLVMAGQVQQLKRQGRRRFAVGLEGDLDASLTRLAGAEVVTGRDGLAVVEIEDTVDPQRVLDAARDAGAVTHFSQELPHLSELFRQAVSQ